MLLAASPNLRSYLGADERIILLVAFVFRFEHDTLPSAISGPSAYALSHTGGLFSRKARAPSRESAEAYTMSAIAANWSMYS